MKHENLNKNVREGGDLVRRHFVLHCVYLGR